MLVSRAEALEQLRCPRTLLPLRRNGPDELVTAAGDHGGPYRYPVVRDLPILIDFESSVLDERETVARSAHSPVPRRAYRGPVAAVQRLVGPPNPASAGNIRQLIERVKRSSAEPRVLVIGGGIVGDGTQALYADAAIKLLAFDIYGTPNVQFVADAHRIPVPDETFDGVIIQAVLQVVLQPAAVVAEIIRVLKPGGMVYAESSFLQHVTEGAYDFTRFTVSGHRYLFRDFELLATGVTGGAGVQLMWSLDYFARSLFRSRAAGKAVKTLFFWLRLVDRIIPDRFAVDAASGAYFLGHKSAAPLGPKDVVAFYRGAQT